MCAIWEESMKFCTFYNRKRGRLLRYLLGLCMALTILTVFADANKKSQEQNELSWQIMIYSVYQSYPSKTQSGHWYQYFRCWLSSPLV